MKRAVLNFPSVTCDLLDSSKKEDAVPILLDISSSSGTSGGSGNLAGRTPPIYVIGENGKNVGKVNCHSHPTPTKA